MKIGPIAIVLAIGGAAAFALFRSPSPAPIATDQPVAAPVPEPAETMDDPHGGMLPPNHPPIGNGDSPHAPALPPPSDEAPAITWKAPDAWKSAPNPSTMRLATFKIAPAKGDTEEAELAISRAGGAKEANIQRWIGQFDDAGKDTRTEKTVHGIKITIVEVAGTYLGGGMMPGAGGGPKKGWALLGAIVETPGMPYFFKMTGPAATVHGARPAFEKMLDSIAPAK